MQKVKREYISEWKSAETADGSFAVYRYSGALTAAVYYEAWEAAAGHSTIRYTPEKLGKVTTRSVAAEILAMRAGSEERIAAAAEERERIERISLAAVLAAFPEVMKREGARVDGGNVVTYENVGEVVGSV